jgi:hypothetical protein
VIESGRGGVLLIVNDEEKWRDSIYTGINTSTLDAQSSVTNKQTKIHTHTHIHTRAWRRSHPPRPPRPRPLLLLPPPPPLPATTSRRQRSLTTRCWCMGKPSSSSLSRQTMDCRCVVCSVSSAGVWASLHFIDSPYIL